MEAHAHGAGPQGRGPDRLPPSARLITAAGLIWSASSPASSSPTTPSPSPSGFALTAGVLTDAFVIPDVDIGGPALEREALHAATLLAQSGLTSPRRLPVTASRRDGAASTQDARVATPRSSQTAHYRLGRRGRSAARSEWRLIAATHNLLKLCRHTTAPLPA
jgi:hypothetical protein